MGCTASKRLEMQARMDGNWSPPISRSFIRSLSMPLRQLTQEPHQKPSNDYQKPSEDSHSVALTSTTYGVLKLPDLSDEVSESQITKPSENESEVTKPSENESEVSPVPALPSVPEVEVIDVKELMKDLNTFDEDNIQTIRKRRRYTKNNKRALNRSISSVDSMRELDVKIRSVVLALPNLEKKLRALDALNSIMLRGEIDENLLTQKWISRTQSTQQRETNTSVESTPKKQLHSSKSTKGLFYGETLEKSTATLSTSSSTCSSSSSYDALSSLGESEESSLFDPEVLKSFQSSPEDSIVPKKMKSSKVLPVEADEEKLMKKSPLDGYIQVCPPRGEERVVLYITSLRGIRKTFEDCNTVRVILQGFGVEIDERDVSMHAEFRNELKELLSEVMSRTGTSDTDRPPMPVPRLFIKGRYVGGVEELGRLNEEGIVGGLLEGIPRGKGVGICEGCGGVRFVPCFECSGSCKVVVFGGSVGDFSGSGVVVRCGECNENGLIRCPVCL